MIFWGIVHISALLECLKCFMFQNLSLSHHNPIFGHICLKMIDIKRLGVLSWTKRYLWSLQYADFMNRIFLPFVFLPYQREQQAVILLFFSSCQVFFPGARSNASVFRWILHRASLSIPGKSKIAHLSGKRQKSNFILNWHTWQKLILCQK